MKITNQIKNTKGFSLVELMVVVAIIGILAAIAVPNVTRYMLKARQSEAKSNLAAIYSAEKALFVEYNGYARRFQTIGFAPEGVLKYNVGFDADDANASLTGYTAPVGQFVVTRARGWCNNGGGGVAAGNACTCNASNAECNGVANIGVGGLVTTSTPNTFLAGATSNLRRTGLVGDFDVWSINETKNLRQMQDGVK